jgi:hypothetical protein
VPAVLVEAAANLAPERGGVIRLVR